MVLDHEPPVYADDKYPHFRIMKHHELHEEYDRILHLDTDIIIKMIEKDPSIVKAMDRAQWNRLKYYI